jgi:hypothetical protein
VDVGLLVGSVNLGGLLVDGRKKGGQDFQLQALCKKRELHISHVYPGAHAHTDDYLLARLFSSSIFPFKWLEVVQASVKVIPLALSAYLVSRSPMMTPDLLSRRPLTLKVYKHQMKFSNQTDSVPLIEGFNLQHRWGRWS